MIVYWIRKKEHTDIYTQGYVGVTKTNLEERVRSHKKNYKNSIVAGKLRKYDDLVCEVIHNVPSLAEALELEAKYRPTPMVGWNLQRGGELGVEPEWYLVPENKEKHSMKTSEATRRGIAANDTTEARSERAKENHRKYRDKYKAAATGERNSRAILSETDVEKIKHELIPQGLKNPEIALMFGVKPYVISFIRTGKNWGHV
jgi:hypothetical protein